MPSALRVNEIPAILCGVVKSLAKRILKGVNKMAAKKKASKKKTTTKKTTTKKKVAKKTTKKVAKKTTTKKVAKAATPAKKAVAKKAATNKTSAASPAKEKKAVSAKPQETVKIAQELSSAVKEKASKIILTDAEGRTLCRYTNCDQASTVEGYCRYHYLLHWKMIQLRKKILSEGKLEKYVQELTARYPDKFIDILLKDLATDKDFSQICHDIGIITPEGEGDEDDSFAVDGEMSNEGF